MQGEQIAHFDGPSDSRLEQYPLTSSAGTGSPKSVANLQVDAVKAAA